MYHLKLPVQTVLLSVMLYCVSTVPHNRYFLSSNEKHNDVREGDGWLDKELYDKPYVRFIRPRPQRELNAVNSHHIDKRKCNTATCVTQRLADFLFRSSNTIGTSYAPTNVGSRAYGKRGAPQTPIYVLL